MVENFRTLFKDVYKVYSNAKQHEEEMKERGEKYSVFSAMGVERSELIHSAFIKDLLDPKGMHGMKDTFLKSFLNHVGLGEDFLESTSVISKKRCVLERKQKSLVVELTLFWMIIKGAELSLRIKLMLVTKKINF